MGQSGGIMAQRPREGRRGYLHVGAGLGQAQPPAMIGCQSTKVDKAPVIMYHTIVAALESVMADVHVLVQHSGVAKR